VFDLRRVKMPLSSDEYAFSQARGVSGAVSVCQEEDKGQAMREDQN
jgi:hypothetical protein